MEGDQREALHLLGKLNAWPTLPIRMGHWGGILEPLDSREGGREGISPQDLDSRRERRVGQQMRETGVLWVKVLGENVVLPVQE